MSSDTWGYRIREIAFHVGRGVALRLSWPIRIQKGSLLHNDFYVRADKSRFLDSNRMFPTERAVLAIPSHRLT